MQDYVVNRPDPEAMRLILEENADHAAGVVLRLAWQAGLMRDEIQHLTWAQVDFSAQQITLAERAVPISKDLADYLMVLWSKRNGRSETVVLSDRDQKPLTPQSISRLARQVLDGKEQTAVRLIDLRHDFVLRQLEQHDWQYVSRITGIEAAAMNVHFASYLKEKRVSTRIHRESHAQIDEFALWKLLQTERGTPVGVTLWMTWQLGLHLDEIVALTWDQVDFERECLRLADRTVLLTGGVLNALKELRAATPKNEGKLLISPRSGRPYERTRLSKLVRTALIQGGLDDVTLRDLRVDCSVRSGGENEIMACLRQRRSVTRNEVAELLNIPTSTAYHRLKQMESRGKLTQIGARYYLRDTVVPPEQQAEVVVEYLSREGFAYRQDIARILKIDPRQCRSVLQKLVASGHIAQERQRYILKKDA